MIKISNQNTVPYGVLSVDYNDNFFVNKLYKNVIDYTTSEFNIKLTKPYKLSLDNVWISLEKNKIFTALKESIDAKIKSLPSFSELLLQSENKNIIYKTDNNVFGVDNKFKGENLYGKFLTYYRNILNNESSNVFYKKYVLEQYLKYAIYNEKLDEYISMAQNGFNLDYIISKLQEKYPELYIQSESVVKQLKETTRESEHYENLPTETIILKVIKNKLRDVKVTNTIKLKQKIFRTYLKNIFIKKKINYDLETFIKKMDTSEGLSEKVFESYLEDVSKGLIPPNTEIYIPTEEEIKSAENLQLLYTNKSSSKKIDSTNINNNNLIIDNNNKLSMFDDEFLFKVEDKFFPSIYHYVLYKVGGLILGEDPYNIVHNSENNTFYRLHDSKNILKNKIISFKNTYFPNKLIEGLRLKINQKPYLLDYIKSVGNNKIITTDFYSAEVGNFYNDLNKNTNWNIVMNSRGNVIDYIDSDSFFIFTQKEMFESFANILTIVNPGNNKHSTILLVYENFFGNIPGTIIDIENKNLDYKNIKDLSKKYNVNLSDESCSFLKNVFVHRILSAEKCSKILFNTDIIYMTKFLIIESRYKIFTGAFLDERRIYTDIYAKITLAMAKVINSVFLSDKKPNLLTNSQSIFKQNIEKAYDILSSFKMLESEQFNVEDNLNLEDYQKSDDENESIIDEDDDSREEIDYVTLDPEENLYNDLVYGNDEIMDVNIMAMEILALYEISDKTMEFFTLKCVELFNNPNKNTYRINLYQ